MSLSEVEDAISKLRAIHDLQSGRLVDLILTLDTLGDGMEVKKFTICGIDPGKNGGAAKISNDGILLDKATMFFQGKNEFDPIAYADFLTGVDHVFIEKVSARPGNGGVSMFNFGQAYMFCQIVPKLLKIPITLVTPQQWQKTMHVGVDKTLDPKQRSLVAFTRLFPNEDLRATDRCTKQHDGIIDALLLAEYGRRFLRN